MTLFKRYLKIICSIYALLLLFRTIETILIFYKYGFGLDVFFYELEGLVYDVLGASIFIVAYFFIFFLFCKIRHSIANTINIILLLFVSLLFFASIAYFINQLAPLDTFLFKYSFREVYFTVSTSDTDFLITGIAFVLLLGFIALLVWRIFKIKFRERSRKFIYAFVLLSLPLFFIAKSVIPQKHNNFVLNKPFYFAYKSLKYGLASKDKTKNTAAAFQKLYPEKTFISESYPFMYKIKREPALNPYFATFNKAPNIVILIIEGLNDDFIHEYKGAMLMPFLHQLKNKSLYWNRFFTLGERSYAVVPSILGGLPYGDRGFTMQDGLPLHTSLVSVLNANNYYTSFYYGQGAWFHRKDRFFKYNDIDLIFDNKNFSDNYNKIIVGKDNFFWGYTDKDLFEQSLQVIDTAGKQRRLDIYFTGTTHSPYVIDDEAYYSKKLNAITPKGYETFYQTHAKYLKTILFLDDALKDFFDAHKKRNDYENTIFLITGDHPMTEVPIANSLKRYHVPLIIFSEKLKDSHVFTETASHLDVSETLLSFLAEYINNVPEISTSLGEHLLHKTNTDKNIAFMNTNREVVDFLCGNYYLSEDVLYEVDSNLNISLSKNKAMKSELAKKLSTFANMSLYVSRNNKVISPRMYCQALEHELIFSLENKDSITHTAAEFFNLADKIPIANSKQIFDVSFNISAAKYENIGLVYQVSNAKDSILLWKNLSVTEEEVTQNHISIPPFNNAEEKLYFSAYIWNQNKVNFEISNIDVLLHTPKTKSYKNKE